MSRKGSFSRVSRQSQKPMYGPRAVLACGYHDEDLARLHLFFDVLPLRNLPVVLAGDADAHTPVGDLLKRRIEAPPEAPSGLPAAIVMSGLSEKELHMLVGAYRQTGLPRPLWASLTPISESWPLTQLLAELAAERERLEGPQPR